MDGNRVEIVSSGENLGGIIKMDLDLAKRKARKKVIKKGKLDYAALELVREEALHDKLLSFGR